MNRAMDGDYSFVVGERGLCYCLLDKIDSGTFGCVYRASFISSVELASDPSLAPVDLVIKTFDVTRP